MNISVMNEIVERMRPKFRAHVAAAGALVSPNTEDTLLVKCAIVGFSQYSATENWTKGDHTYVSENLADGSDCLSDDELKLKALCLGGLCGLLQQKKLSDQELTLAEMHLPGLILLYAGKI